MVEASPDIPVPVQCAWCRTWLKEPADDFDPATSIVSHGICVTCMGGLFEKPVMDVGNLTDAAAEALPFGLIELSADGYIRTYGVEEGRRAGFTEATVAGKHFFLDIAPCTRDSEFQRRWDALLERGFGTDDFEFIFAFASGHRDVRVRMFVDRKRDMHLILLQDQR